MIELEALARSESLKILVADPPPLLRPENGTVGVGLRYDPVFVAMVDARLLLPASFARGGVEHSALLAARLEQAARADPAFGLPEMGSDSQAEWDAEGTARQWRLLSSRRFGRLASPVQIEVTTAPRSGEPTRHSPDLWHGPFPIVLRRARRARLHAAGNGGRVEPRPATASTLQAWGTLGGFLLGATNDTFMAMTAEHVVPKGVDKLVATPAFRSAPGSSLKRGLKWASASLWPERISGAETGQVCYAAPADRVPRNACDLHGSPDTKGLDFALANWPGRDRVDLRAAPAVGLGEVTQVLRGRFAGAYSGTTAVRVTHYTIWHAYDFDEEGSVSACVANCLEIALAERPRVWTDVSHAGDSGAWVVCDGQDGPRWLGLLVGGDGERTGVVRAHRIMDTLRPVYGELVPMV